MGDSPLIEIALGLLFVFTLFSVLVSAANEIVVSFFKSRSASLWDGVLTLFNNDEDLRTKFFDHPLIKSLQPPKSISLPRLDTMRRNVPSYIEPRTFAIALLDLLKNPRGILEEVERELSRTLAALRAGDMSGLTRVEAALRNFEGQLDQTTAPGQALAAEIKGVRSALGSATTITPVLVSAVDDLLTRLPRHQRAAFEASIRAAAPKLEGVLTTLAESAAGSVEALRDEIEGWFRQGMESVSGWYKRWTQAMQFGIGLLLAASVNLDVVRIAEALQADAQLRHTTAAQATEYARNQSVDDRSVSAKASIGAFPVTLDPEGPQTFALHAQLAKAPQDASKITAEFQPPVKGGTLNCDPFTVDSSLNATATCRTAGVATRTDATIRISYQSQDAQTLAASLAVVVPSDSEAYYKDALVNLRATTLPMAWQPGSVDYFYKHPFWVVFGWLIAALGGSFGAPFWFDLLKRVANLRGSEPNPEERKSNRSKT